MCWGHLQTTLTVEQITSGTLDEPTLFPLVQACAVVPGPLSKTLSPSDNGRWQLRLSALPVSPGVSPVRCVSLDADSCALVWIAAAEASASLGLPLWSQPPVEVSGELDPDDVSVLAAAIIALHTDPALTTIQVPPLRGRVKPFGPLVGDGPDGCAQTTPPTPPSQTALIQISLSATLCDLEQLQKRLTGRALLTYAPPTSLPSLPSPPPRLVDQARLATLLQHLTQAAPAVGVPSPWFSDTTDAVLLDADLDLSSDLASQLATSVNLWLLNAERLLLAPPASSPLPIDRAQARALRHIHLAALQSSASHTPVIVLWHWQQAQRFGRDASPALALHHFARAALWAHVLATITATQP